MVRTHREIQIKQSSSSIVLVLWLILIALIFYYFGHENEDKQKNVKKARSIRSACFSLSEDPTQYSKTTLSPLCSSYSAVPSALTVISSCDAVLPKAEKVKSLPHLFRKRSQLLANDSNSTTVSSAEEPSILGTPSCDCRANRDVSTVLRDDEAVFKEGVTFCCLPTKTKPYNFAKYDKQNLLLMSDKDLETGISFAARELENNNEENVLTAFRPILQCIVYSAKHCALLDHLAEEYMYLGED